MRCLCCLLVASGLLAFGVSPGRGEVPEKYKPAIKKGLEWLVKQQKPNGSWTGPNDLYPISLTSLAGLAVLMEGSTTSKGLYADNIKRGADWLLKNCQKGTADDGMIGERQIPGEAGRYMFGQSYGMLFLASVYAEENNGARRLQMKETLNRAVQFSVKAQNSKGGWFYVSSRDGQDTDEACVSLCQIQGLRAARLAGIPVPNKTLQKALAYLTQNTGPGGGLYYASNSKNERPALTAAAIACAYSPADYKSDVVKKWLKYCQTQIPQVGGPARGHDEFTHFYYAQVLHGLGDKGYDKLFNGATDRLQWSKYRETFFAHLVKTQKEDGSWLGAGGAVTISPVYTTALHLAILQLDNEVLPILGGE